MTQPIQYWLENAGFAILGAAIAVPIIRLNIRFARRLGWIDWPKARGLAEEQIPIVGPSLVLISVLAFITVGFVFEFSPWLITTSLILALMGHLDDKKPLPPADKFFVQLLCATTVVLFDPNIYQAIVIPFGALGCVLAVIFVVGLVNAINFIDGIDGLAGLVIGAGTIGYLFLNFNAGTLPAHAIVASLLFGAVAVFLFFNVLKRQCFIGNTGSYFLSYVLAVMHLSVPLQSPGAIPRFTISALCFIVPIADSLMVVSLRLATLRSPFQADKSHLHHRLIQAGLPLRTILLNFAVIEGFGVLLALALSGLSTRPSTLPVLVGLSVIGISTMLVLMLDKTSKRRIETYFRRLDAGEPIYYLKYQVTQPGGGPLSSVRLRRLESRVSAEIRVNDLCYLQRPDQIFITLQTLPEPLKSIMARVDNVFRHEKVAATLIVDQGEIVKVSYQNTRSILKRA